MRQDDLLDYLKVHGPMTATQIAMGMYGYEWTKLNVTNIRKKLYRLKRWQMVQVVGTRMVEGNQTNVWGAVE